LGEKVFSTFRALGYYNYRLFFFGQIVSLSGTWMQSVAQSWLVYRLTGSVTLLGLIGFAGQFPIFLLAALGGAVADKYSRRNILIATQTTAMTTASVLAFLTLTNLI
jgi:MFS family permease